MPNTVRRGAVVADDVDAADVTTGGVIAAVASKVTANITLTPNHH